MDDKKTNNLSGNEKYIQNMADIIGKEAARAGEQIAKLMRTSHEFVKTCQMAEARVKSFDRANTQPYQDHAFMEALRGYIKNEIDCDAPLEPSSEMLAKFAVKPGSSNAQVLAIFEDYFKTKRVKIPHEGVTKSVEANNVSKKYMKR